MSSKFRIFGKFLNKPLLLSCLLIAMLPSGAISLMSISGAGDGGNGTAAGLELPLRDWSSTSSAMANAAGITAQQQPLRVLATTTLAADLVRTLGGKRVEVVALMGAGIDPHLYKASENAVHLLSRADVIIYHGLHLEAKLSDVLARLADTKSVIRLGDGIAEELLITEGAGAIADPHIWMDVQLWRQAALHVAAEFARLDPAGRIHYRQAVSRYTAELSALDVFVQQTITAIPAAQRVLITAHDAFRYYGKAYGIEVKALQGISTASRFNLNELQTLQTFITMRAIPAIFAESSVAVHGLEALAASLQASGYAVTLQDMLYSDSLGHPASAGATYLKMIKHNTLAIHAALTAKAAIMPNVTAR